MTNKAATAPTPRPRRKVHFLLNSKGGVGKTHCAVMAMQCYLARNLPIRAFDADAMSASFSKFPQLKVTRIPLMAGDSIDPSQFDAMLQSILTEDANFIVDTGASSFVEVNRYFLRNNVPQLIHEAGKTMVANIIIVGGTMFSETCLNLEAIAEQMPPEVEIVVWLNEHFGAIKRDGKEFEEMEIYGRWRKRIAGLVPLTDWTFTDPATFGEDVRKMMEKGLTFNEIKTSDDFPLMAKHRLLRIQTDVAAKLAKLL